MFFARYLKNREGDKWFKFHLGFQISGFIVALAGAGLIFYAVIPYNLLDLEYFCQISGSFWSNVRLIRFTSTLCSTANWVLPFSSGWFCSSSSESSALTSYCFSFHFSSKSGSNTYVSTLLSTFNSPFSFVHLLVGERPSKDLLPKGFRVVPHLVRSIPFARSLRQRLCRHSSDPVRLLFPNNLYHRGHSASQRLENVIRTVLSVRSALCRTREKS
jgi:hypothetical protein